MTALRAMPAFFGNGPDDDAPDATEALSDLDIVGLLMEADVDRSLLEAAVYAVRNDDFGYLVRQYERQAAPVIQSHVETQAASDAADAAEARDEAMQDARMEA